MAGTGGGRPAAAGGLDRLASASALIGVLSYVVALLLYNGVFLGGPAACHGLNGMTCLVGSLAALVIGGGVGALVALGALVVSGKQRWLGWLALELNLVAILGVGAFLLWAWWRY